jgi:hypothetical protein
MGVDVNPLTHARTQWRDLVNTPWTFGFHDMREISYQERLTLDTTNSSQMPSIRNAMVQWCKFQARTDDANMYLLTA